MKNGIKITKRYDKAKTPYERLLECNEKLKRKEEGCAGLSGNVNQIYVLYFLDLLYLLSSHLDSLLNKRNF